MINRPPSNIQPLSSEDARTVARHIIMAIGLLPTHRHNKKVNPADCDTCVAKNYLVGAFQMFKRFGD